MFERVSQVICDVLLLLEVPDVHDSARFRPQYPLNHSGLDWSHCIQTPRRQRVSAAPRPSAADPRATGSAAGGVLDAQSPSAQLRHSELKIVNGTILQILLCRPYDITVTIRPISPISTVSEQFLWNTLCQCTYTDIPATSPAMTTPGQLGPQNQCYALANQSVRNW
jgi:hypothetical protein